LDVPWEVPKLKRRLQSNNMFNLQQRQGGSDSGISMTSQDVQEIKDLLNVPWDMPKLRKRTQHIFNNPNDLGGSSKLTLDARPRSMPLASQSADCSQSGSGLDLGWSSGNVSNPPQQLQRPPHRNLNLNVGGSAAPIRSRDVTIEALSSEQQQRREDLPVPNANNDDWNNLPPPPPGFEDEFYLTETQPLNANACMQTHGTTTFILYLYIFYNFKSS